MSNRFHGLEIVNENTAILKFGLNNLIGGIPPSYIEIVDLANAQYEILYAKKFLNNAFIQCGNKMQYCLTNINLSINKIYEQLIVIQNHSDRDINKIAEFQKAHRELPYHIDALLMNFRILPDCIALIIPYFYNIKNKIASRGFREHLNWFKNNPTFDSEYFQIIKYFTSWFETLAGKVPKGIRDIAFHNFGTYQTYVFSSVSGKNIVKVNQISANITSDENIILCIKDAFKGFCEYLDLSYILFGNRLKNEFPNLIAKSLEEISHLFTINGYHLIDKYQFYPIISRQ